MFKDVLTIARKELKSCFSDKVNLLIKPLSEVDTASVDALPFNAWVITLLDTGFPLVNDKLVSMVISPLSFNESNLLLSEADIKPDLLIVASS